MFRLFGYDALGELEDRLFNYDKERKVVLFIRFDNCKVVYCRNKELRVNVPTGAKSITSIEMATYRELVNLKQRAVGVLDDPEDTYLKGLLGEAITKERFINEILSEISGRSGVSKDGLKVEWLGETEPRGKVPDFVIRNAETNKRIAVVEVKYVSDPEDTETFRRQLNNAIKEIRGRLADPEWAADYGVIVIIAWPPEWVLGEIPYPAKIGEFNNPHIEYFSKEGG
ncbi:MAG: hypothetical protein ACUVQY_05995 [Thermoproteota archaeon]